MENCHRNSENINDDPTCVRNTVSCTRASPPRWLQGGRLHGCRLCRFLADAVGLECAYDGAQDQPCSTGWRRIARNLLSL